MESVGTKRKAVELRSTLRLRSGQASRGDCPYASTRKLVAAGVVLGRNEDEAWARRLLPGGAAKRVQNANDSGVGSENSQANGCDDGYEEQDGHE